MGGPECPAFPRGVVLSCQGLGWAAGGGGGRSSLPGHVPLQEVEKSHPDLLQLPWDLEQPAQAAG